MESENMRKKATDALLSIGIPMKQPGFLYIVDAMELFEENGAPITNMKIVYHKIARKRNSNPDFVMENIARSITDAYKTGNVCRWMDFFGLGLEKKSNGNYLAMMWQRLKEEEVG